MLQPTHDRRTNWWILVNHRAMDDFLAACCKRGMENSMKILWNTLFRRLSRWCCVVFSLDEVSLGVLATQKLLKNGDPFHYSMCGPIGSMVLLYMVTWIPSHQYTPNMLAYIPAPWILWGMSLKRFPDSIIYRKTLKFWWEKNWFFPFRFPLEPLPQVVPLKLS